MPTANVSRRRKYVRKKSGPDKRTSAGERSWCMECKRWVGRGGKPSGKPVPKTKQDLALSHGYCRPCGESMKAEMRRQALAIRKAKAAKANPKCAVRRAVKKSTEFHGKPPRRIAAVPMTWPKALVHLGPCAQLDYVSDKFDTDDKMTRYFHEFTGRCDVFAAPTTQPNGDGLLILLGNFKLKPEGITG